MMNIHTVKPLVERFERLLNTATALLHKIQSDYDQIRKQRAFHSFFLPGGLFKPLEQDFEELYAMLQALTLALENIQTAMQQENP